MRPLKLVLQGFKPFRERQEIDFSKLEFFVIRGPTGSGKSSILDAITYALFGETATKVKAEELINKNASNLFIDFTFLAGGKEYRVQIARKRKGGSDFRFFENGVKRATRSDAIRREIRRILGVDAKQFKKIFFLPQGQYAAFFTSDPAERRELIISLLDLEIYNLLAERVKEHLDALKNRLAGVEGQLLTLAEATPENIERLKGERKKLLNLLEEVRGKIETLEGELKRLTLLKERLERRREVLGEIERLTGGEYAALRGEVEALKPLKGLLPLLQRYLLKVETLKELQREVGELTAQIGNLGNNLAEKRQGLEGLKTRLEEIEERREEVERYRKLLGYLEALEPVYNRLKGEREALKNLSEELKTLLQKREHLEGELRKEEKALEETLRRLEENPYTPEGEGELRLKLNLCRERDRLTSEAERVSAELQREELEEERLLSEVERTEKLLREVSERLEEYRRKEREYLVYLLVRELKEGDPCPVCGNPLTDLKGHFPEDFDPQRLTALEEEELRLRERLENLKRKLEAVRAKAGELRRRLTELNERLEEYLNLPPTEEVERRLKLLREAKGEREVLEGERERLENRIALLKNSLAGLEGRIKTLESNLEERKKRFETELEKVKGTLQRLFKELGVKPPKGKNAFEYLKGYLEGEIETYERERNNLETRLRELETSISALEGELKTKRRQLEERKGELRALREELERLEAEMKEGGWDGGDPEKLFQRLSKLPQLEERLETFEREIAALRAELESLNRALEGVTEEEVFLRLGELERELDTLKGREGEILSQLGAVEETIKRLEEALKRRKLLEEERDKLRREIALLEAVKADFRSDRLIKFVVDRAVADLVELAGEYLYKLSDRYRFTLEEGEIKVEDQFLGAVRNVKTLSGGETFLASLSFALALGEYIGKNASVESLFIDEGFGTLDKERLERIGELFEKLRHSVDKVVGVITHLDELALRFDQRIEVIPSPNGSKVKVIY